MKVIFVEPGERMVDIAKRLIAQHAALTHNEAEQNAALKDVIRKLNDVAADLDSVLGSAPDANCVTRADGECVSEKACMHGGAPANAVPDPKADVSINESFADAAEYAMLTHAEERNFEDDPRDMQFVSLLSDLCHLADRYGLSFSNMALEAIGNHKQETSDALPVVFAHEQTEVDIEAACQASPAPSAADFYAAQAKLAAQAGKVPANLTHAPSFFFHLGDSA